MPWLLYFLKNYIFILKITLLKNDFIYFLVVLGLHCSLGFSLAVESGGYSLVEVHRLLSLQRLLLLWRTGSMACGLSSCGICTQWLQFPGSRAQAQKLWRLAYLLQGTWDLPTSGIEPLSPAMAGRFLTTESPEAPKYFYLFIWLPWVLVVIYGS